MLKIEEERTLRETREKEELELRKTGDAEYLNKKYQILSQVVDSESDDEDAEEEEVSRTM